jgi:hypothetical protein
VSKASQETRTLSNFILNAVLSYIKEKKGIVWNEEDGTVERSGRGENA